MFFTRRHCLFLLVYLYCASLPTPIDACNIWKASDCPQPPTADDEEIFKYDLYTRQQLFQFCDRGKKYIECVNKHLQCCDLKSEHAGALAAFEVGLEQSGWRLGRYCAGIGGNTIIQYKCKTTTLPPARTTTTTTTTTTAIPSCEVEEAARECNDILEDRLRFEKTWSAYGKIKWCKAVAKYVQCAGKHITNCSIMEVRDDVEQLSSFIDHLIKQANRYCHGGFSGCENAMNDVRCTQSEGSFYSGEVFDSATKTLILNWYLIVSTGILWCWTQLR